MLDILTSSSVKQSGGNETVNEQMSILYTCIHVNYKLAQEITGMRHLLHSYIIGLRRMDNKFTPDYITVAVVNKVAVT
jgi:hypothetical protein